jgi:hypothetical protein
MFDSSPTNYWSLVIKNDGAVKRWVERIGEWAMFKTRDDTIADLSNGVLSV